MFQNDNKAVIKRLAKLSLKADKQRNTFAVIAIALTTILFTSVVSIGVGVIESLKQVIELTLAMNASLFLAIMPFLLMFIFIGYLLINNIFDISISKDIRRYAMWRTIGTTQRQIKKIVLRQAIQLSFIGIPLGLLLGYLIGKISLPLMMQFLNQEYSDFQPKMSLSPFIFIVSSLFSLLTVWVSVKKPAQIATLVSPIDALRYTENGHITKTFSKKASFFRIEKMSWANFLRSKKRSIFIILSLLICFVLLNSVAILGQSVDTDKYLQKMMSTDYVIASKTAFSARHGFMYHSDGLDEAVISLVEQQPGIQNGGKLYKNTLDDLNVTIDYGQKITETNESIEGIKYGFIVDGQYPIVLGNDGYALCNVYGASTPVLSRLMIINGEKDKSKLIEKLSTGNYIIEGAEDAESFQCEIGHEIVIRKDGKILKTMTVVAQAVLNGTEREVWTVNSGYTTVGGNCPFFYMSDYRFKEVYTKPTLMNYSFDFDNANQSNIENTLNSYILKVDAGMQYGSTQMLRQSIDRIKKMVYVAGGILSFLIGCIGVINFVSIIKTNAITRQYEFTLFESIGMTKKQLRKLLVYEGIYYAIISGFFGIVISYIFSKTLLSKILSSSSFWFFTINITLVPALIAFILMLGISMVVPLFAIKALNRHSIIERLKETTW